MKGLIAKDEAERELPALRAARDRLRAEIERADEPPKIVTQHPAAVRHYLAAIEQLELTIKAGAPFGAESKTALRDLIARVTVRPAEPGAAPEITSRGS